jgi:acyl dehydratase
MSALPPVGAAVTDLAAGPVDAAWIARYLAAAGDHNPLHRDPAAALAAGFAGILVPGVLLMGLCERAVRRWLEGEGSAAGGLVHLGARFMRPVIAPATVRVTGRVVQARPERVVLRLFAGPDNAPPACIAEAWCRPDGAA